MFELGYKTMRFEHVGYRLNVGMARRAVWLDDWL